MSDVIWDIVCSFSGCSDVGKAIFTSGRPLAASMEKVGGNERSIASCR